MPLQFCSSAGRTLDIARRLTRSTRGAPARIMLTTLARSARRGFSALAAAFALASAATATAQEALSAPPARVQSAGVEQRDAAEMNAPAVGAGAAFTLPKRLRPALLPALYLSFAAFQILDADSTRSRLQSGACEVNPAMRRVASRGPLLVALKAGATAGTIYLVERLWKKNERRSLTLMAAINSAYLIIVTNNSRLRQPVPQPAARR